jgi:hypothetical protein
MQEQLGLVKIYKKYGFVNEVKLQALIGNPWVKNYWDMSKGVIENDTDICTAQI